VTAVVALHDLKHHCDQIHVLHNGRQSRSGTPE
jgi:iron complex transport system ATP-binding protein